MAQSILIVEDESIVALDLQSRLNALGFSVQGIAKSGERALEMVTESSPDIVLMDVQLAGSLDGIETARLLREIRPVPVIFLTAYSDQDSIQRAKTSFAYGYLLKPFQERELIITIELALYKFEAELKLRSNRLLLDATLNGIQEGVISIDAAGRVVFMNSAAELMTDVSMEEARGRLLEEIVIPEELDTTEDEPDSWQFIRRPDGSRIPVEVQAHRLTATTDGPVAITVLRDISELRRYRRSLVEAKNAAEAAARAKSIFLSKMSHEFRTPLNGILGMAQLSLEEAIGDPLRGYLQVLKRSAENLLQLVNDILVTAQSGTDIRRTERFSPANLIETIVRSHAFEINRRGLRLVLRVDPRIPANISADPRLVGQILEKLLSNAIKFTRDGYIEVSVTFIDQNVVDAQDTREYFTVHPCRTGAFEPRVVLHVTDTGIGIPDDKIDSVFQDYFQIDDRVNRAVDGAGLGLAVVARLAEEIGAGLSLSSNPGSGSVFRVEIPVPAENPSAAHEQTDKPSAKSSGVVVYTDDALLARSITLHADYLGAEIHTIDIESIRELIRGTAINTEGNVRVVLSAAGYMEIVEDSKLFLSEQAVTIILVDAFTDRTEIRALDGVRTIRYKEPLATSSIHSILFGENDSEDGIVEEVSADRRNAIRDRIFEIVRTEDPVEIGRDLAKLRSSTQDPVLQEILFRLTIAYKRSDTEKAAKILEQLARGDSSTAGG